MSVSSRIRRVLLVLLALVLVVAVASTVSVAPGLEGKLVDVRGEPLAGAYVAYYWKGYRFNFVDSITYERPGTILRTDAKGRYRIRGFVHLHRPLDSRLSTFIALVYVPELHHAFGPLARQTESIPGRVEIDRDVAATTLAELTDDPAHWSRSMSSLYSLIACELGPEKTRYRVPASVRRELAIHLLQDYAAFMERHASTPREIDPDSAASLAYLSPAEREERLETWRARIEREPFWGQWMARMWDDNVRFLRRLARESLDQD